MTTTTLLKRKKMVLTGGGTGGHAFPAIAIAEELTRRDVQVLYIGSPKGFESRLAPERGIPFLALQSGAVKNQSPLTIVKTFFQLLRSVWSCLRLFRREKPDAVIGVGGYVSVPASLAAFLLRIPLYLQEQNTSVGIANRFLGRLSRKVFIGFPQAAAFFPASRCLVTGNPVREEFFSPGATKYNAHGNHLVVFGGSQGSQAINNAVLNFLPRLKSLFPAWSLLHQTGQRDFNRVQKFYSEFGIATFRATPFVESVLEAYSKATLIIARSGALTCSELIQVGRPAILVPYPRQGQNDQATNAYYLEQSGCARVVEQGADFEKRLWNTIEDTLKPEILEKMAEAFSQLRMPPALASIVDHLEMDLRLRNRV